MYMYIYIERERERKKKRFSFFFMFTYIQNTYFGAEQIQMRPNLVVGAPGFGDRPRNTGLAGYVEGIVDLARSRNREGGLVKRSSLRAILPGLRNTEMIMIATIIWIMTILITIISMFMTVLILVTTAARNDNGDTDANKPGSLFSGCGLSKIRLPGGCRQFRDPAAGLDNANQTRSLQFLRTATWLGKACRSNLCPI